VQQTQEKFMETCPGNLYAQTQKDKGGQAHYDSGAIFAQLVQKLGCKT
jgi:hypothetical protein